MVCVLASFHKNLYPLLCFLTLARLCVCQPLLRHRECLIGQLPVFIVNVQMASEGGFEVDVDGQLASAFRDDNIVNQQPQVAVADCSLLDDLPKNINAAFISAFRFRIVAS